MDLRDLIEAQKALITDRLDPDFGLLDELLVSRSLTRSEVADVKAVSHSYGRSGKLLEYVSNRGIYEKFLDALRDTQQTHLANFILSNGERLPQYGDDWPLTEREISILDTNQRSLVDLLETCDLLRLLYSCKVVNNRQRDFVSSKTTSHEKNDALLEILRRTSLQNYKKTIYCLHSSKQSHIADLLKEGGGVVRIRSELETESDVNEVEDELITKITDILGDRSLGDSARILKFSELRLIAAKKGNSIILYFFCKTSAELVYLQEMETSGKLANAVREMFNEILSRPQVTNLRTTLYDEDSFKRDLSFHEKAKREDAEEKAFADKAKVDDMGEKAFANKAKMEDAGEKAFADKAKMEDTGEKALSDKATMKDAGAKAFAYKAQMGDTGEKALADKAKVENLGEKAFTDKAKVEDRPTGEKAEKQLREITECPICMDAFTDPRMLPCIHTFCFECLKRTAEEAQKKTGDTMPCPLCRKEFTIPPEGIEGLQKNFFMENLLEFKATLQTQEPTVKNGSEAEKEKRRISAVKSCIKHTNKPLDHYCADCKKIVCVSCFFESHKMHDCKHVTTVDEEFRQTIEKSAWKILNFADEMLSMRKNTEKRKTDFLEIIRENENAILKRNQDLKDTIDRETKSLLEDLSLIKSKRLKEMETELKEMDKSLTVLRSFEAYCTELRSKVSASDICSSVDAFIAIANELEREHEAFIGRPHQSVEVSFEATDLGGVLQNFNSNLVGNVEDRTETVSQFENCAVVVGLNDALSITNDVVKINLHRPNEISVQPQVTTKIQKEATAAVYCNTMYVTGIGIFSHEIWKYNIASGWMKCASLVQGRRRHSAAFIDEALYICGGIAYFDESILDSVEAYNAVTNKCTAVGKLVHGVHSSGNCVPFRNSLYIFGGKDKDSSIPSKSLLNLFGGSDKVNNAYCHVQIYNTKENTCTLLSKPMPRSSFLMRAALWETSAILLGCDTCFIFNFETEIWQERKQLKTDVVHFGLFLDNERLFVIGGGNSETYKDGIVIWKCKDDVRSVPLQNVIENKYIEWKIHGKLPKPCLVQAFAKLRFLV